MESSGFRVPSTVEPQLLGGITLIVHFLGAKNSGNSKGGEKSLDMGWGLNFIHTHRK